jgi:hypothetical protein
LQAKSRSGWEPRKQSERRLLDDQDRGLRLRQDLQDRRESPCTRYLGRVTEKPRQPMKRTLLYDRQRKGVVLQTAPRSGQAEDAGSDERLLSARGVPTRSDTAEATETVSVRAAATTVPTTGYGTVKCNGDR